MIELDHDLIGRLERGDCCHENNSDAASHILALGDELESLQAELKAAKVFEASYRKHRGELLAELDRLTKLLRDVSKVSQSRVVRTMIDQRLKPAKKGDE